MAPRKRATRKSGWPRGLYERDGYFSWRSSVDGKEYGLGRNRAAAIAEAIEANLHVVGSLQKVRLVDRLRDDGPRTVLAWATKYEALLGKRRLAKNTLHMYGVWLRRFRAEFGDDVRLAAITALQVSEKLEAIEQATPTTAKQLRGLWYDIFREAELAGWIPKNENPVRDTRTRRVSIRRARLTTEVFQRILTATKLPWLRNAMLLALVSGQRRENVIPARFTDVHDGHWFVDQGKTGAKVAIPLELRLDALGMSLGDVVKGCRTSGVLSPYLVHQTERHGRSRPGAPIALQRATDAFTAEVAALGLDWGDRTPPTFHEIRSLAKRMYERQGGIDTKVLLGHKSDSSAELYADARGAEWIHVKVGTV